MSDEQRTAMLDLLEAQIDNLQDDLARVKRDLDACEKRLEELQDEDEDRQRKVGVKKTVTAQPFWGIHPYGTDPRD